MLDRKTFNKNRDNMKFVRVKIIVMDQHIEKAEFCYHDGKCKKSFKVLLKFCQKKLTLDYFAGS